MAKDFQEMAKLHDFRGSRSVRCRKRVGLEYYGNVVLEAVLERRARCRTSTRTHGDSLIAPKHAQQVDRLHLSSSWPCARSGLAARRRTFPVSTVVR